MNISKVPFRNSMYPGANTKVLTALMGWFNESGHIPVGYNSQDPTQVGKQIDAYVRTRIFPGCKSHIAGWDEVERSIG